MDKILDIGCGYNRTPGVLRLDVSPEVAPDVLHDLESYPYPFEDSSFDCVLCIHTIEHISNIVPLMEEVHRILKPGGAFHVVTPHFSSSNSWTDPTHKQHLGFYALDFFCGGEDRVGYYTKVRFAMKSKRMDFHNRHRIFGIQYLANKFPRTFEKYYCWRYPAKNIYVELSSIK